MKSIEKFADLVPSILTIHVIKSHVYQHSEFVPARYFNHATYLLLCKTEVFQELYKSKYRELRAIYLYKIIWNPFK